MKYLLPAYKYAHICIFLVCLCIPEFKLKVLQLLVSSISLPSSSGFMYILCEVIHTFKKAQGFIDYSF